MDHLIERLNRARSGGGILFCGAGFSADCLSFKPEETLGTSAQLLNIFNERLKQNPPFGRLQNAADAAWDRLGDNGMETLLKDRFTVAEVTTDMTGVLRYPWQAIYTTNYDNALEIAAQAAGKAADGLNNTDNPKTETNALPIIHLHGYIKKWDINNIRESCVLGAESYLKLGMVKRWLERFRHDVDMAQAVVFVGFNAADFHLNHAIFDLTGLREKAFFINRPTAMADPDVAAEQKKLGMPLYVGRAGLAEALAHLLQTQAPTAPYLASFREVKPIKPSSQVPTATEIEELFIYGKVESSQLSRDMANGVSEYHVRREAMHQAIASIESGSRILLFTGNPCDGKSLLVNDIAQRLLGARQVYKLFMPYERMLNEVATILHHAPNAALVIENCLDLPIEWLQSIARQFDGKDGVLILTSRDVAVDASHDGIKALQAFNSFRMIALARMSEVEVQSLSDLTDQISGWRDIRAFSSKDRLRFITTVCQSSLPHFLMRLLNSEYVTNRYKEEFNKLSLSDEERAAIILALYITHIGESAPISFLSEVVEMDFGFVVEGLNRKAGNDSFPIVRRKGLIVETVPAIGAQNILNKMFADSEIVNVVVPVLRILANMYRNPFGQHVFSQMMRFSILKDVVTDQDEINRFFEHNKQHEKIRRMPLFWLQWHMAKCSFGELSDAEKLLQQGYAEAEDFERRTGKKFDKRQLDDRRAKLLMLRAKTAPRGGADLFRDFKEACELTEKVIRQDDPQHYPFETLKEIVQAFSETNHKMVDVQRPIVEQWISTLGKYATKRFGMLPKGYQTGAARAALQAAGFPPPG